MPATPPAPRFCEYPLLRPHARKLVNSQSSLSLNLSHRKANQHVEALSSKGNQRTMSRQVTHGGQSFCHHSLRSQVLLHDRVQSVNCTRVVQNLHYRCVKRCGNEKTFREHQNKKQKLSHHRDSPGFEQQRMQMPSRIPTLGERQRLLEERKECLLSGSSPEQCLD